MCKFFSVISDGNGKMYYFDWELRKKCLSGELNFTPDSHTSIATYYGFKGLAEDGMNKYEYNPLTKVFNIDQLNTTDDSACVKQQCKELDFKKIVEPLIIKNIIHPFNDIEPKKVTKKDKILLKDWTSVWASVGTFVGTSVWASVGASVGASVRDSARASVRDSMWDSMWDFVWASVWAFVDTSVRDSARASVRDSVGAFVEVYHSSFFNVKYKFKFSVCVKLWERGFVPSFDGTTWRLHSGPNATVVFEITADELKRLK